MHANANSFLSKKYDESLFFFDGTSNLIVLHAMERKLNHCKLPEGGGAQKHVYMYIDQFGVCVRFS